MKTLFCLIVNILLQGTTVNIIEGSQVWVEDPGDAWIDGLVIKITGKNVVVETPDGKKVYISSKLGGKIRTSSFYYFSLFQTCL